MHDPVELAAAVFEMARGTISSAGALVSVGGPIDQAFDLVAGAYARAPVLWLALSALLILPAVALISLVTRAGSRRMSRGSALRAAQRRPAAADRMDDMPGAAVPSAPRSQAWLTVEGRPGGPMALAGDVIRIGRHGDNDIRLADWSVHRHHAVIERTPDEAFVIADVSGKDGSGVRVNGERKARAQLADGDVIELGRSRLRFENAPV